MRMGFYEEVRGAERFVGVENYIWAINQKNFWNATGNSFFFSGFTVLGHLVIGMGFALLLNRAIKQLSFWRGMQFTPWLFPPAAVSVLWILIYQDQYGLLNEVLRFIGLSSWATNWLGRPGTALAAVTIASIWNWYPFLTLTLLAGMQNIPEELYEAADIDGSGPLRKFIFITIPHLMPVILTICLLDFLWTFRFFDMVWIMTHGGPREILRGPGDVRLQGGLQHLSLRSRGCGWRFDRPVHGRLCGALPVGVPAARERLGTLSCAVRGAAGGADFQALKVWRRLWAMSAGVETPPSLRIEMT